MGSVEESTPSAPRGAASKLFAPLDIADGRIRLEHRIVFAPLTRNRGVPLAEGTADEPNRVWLPDALLAEYYAQRATPGGLLISEGIHPCLEGGGMPGVPGLFHPAHAPAWAAVTAAVHARGGRIFAQLWHMGRCTFPQQTGTPSVSASATPMTGAAAPRYNGLGLRDFPPVEMTEAMMEKTIGEWVDAAKRAVDEAGFDGVEVHGANGYLIEQFLASNTNTRTDAYGGTPAARCRFPLRLFAALVAAIGAPRLAIRLSPFNLYNESGGTGRLETYMHLCGAIREAGWPLAYVHFVEPRFEQIIAAEDKARVLAEWGVEGVSLERFARALNGDGDGDGERRIKVFAAGGYSAANAWGVLERGEVDALVFGRWFLSNPDFVERMREGAEMNPYDRETFYGPVAEERRHVGYTDYPTLAEVREREGKAEGKV